LGPERSAELILEALILSAVLAAALLPIALSTASRSARISCVLAWLGASLLGATAATVYRNSMMEPPVRNRPLEVTRDDYTSSDACRSCHPSQYESWHRSWHRTMTQVVSPETVIGDFEAGPLRIGFQEYELGRKGDEFWVTHYDRDRLERVERRVLMSTGSHHMQFYWFNLDDSNRELGLFPFAYLKEDQKWVPRTAVFMGLETKEAVEEHGRWNRDCLFCHSTAPRPRMTPPRAKTEAVEFGIACEACHGPGGPHVETHAGDPLGRYMQHLDEGGDDSIVQPARLEKEAAVEVCGQCHGVTLLLESWAEHERASVHGFRFRPGERISDSGRVVLRGGEHASEPRIAEAIERYDFDLETTFWSDGMVRVPREHNGLLDSPCYQRGEMTCQSCHVMHKRADDPRGFDEWADDQLGVGMRGNGACTQCHGSFETAPEQHTHHAADSPGSSCQNCHMPYTTYALLKAIRQHEIDVPSVATELDTGRPNACNACHLDQSLAWTAGWMRDWYGQAVPELSPEQREVATGVSWILTGDAAQRGLGAWYAGWEPALRASGGDWMAPHLAQLLEDPYPAVRYIAWRSLRQMSGFDDLPFDYVGPAEERAEVKRAIWRRWDQRGQAPGEQSASLLLYPDGSLDQLALRDMLERRDDRRVIISE